MQISWTRLAALIGLLLMADIGVAGAAPRVETIGGDHFRGGSGSGDLLNAARDVFVSGASVTVRGQAAGDVHVSGFDVDVEIDAENAYAIGGAVTIRSVITEDLTVIGGSVKTTESAQVGGNARLLGGTVTIGGPVDGALMVAGGNVILDAAVAGDVRVMAGELSFGSGARISGDLIYSTPDEIDVPSDVIAAERVTFTALAPHRMLRDVDEWGMDDTSLVPPFLVVFAGFLVTLAFVVLVAALFLAFMPKVVEARRQAALSRPGLHLIVGVLGLSVLFGLVPITGMTLVGILFIPVVILAVFVIWTLGYCLGAYVIGLRVWTGFGGAEPALFGRLLVLAGTVTAVALINFVPFVGWLVNFAIVLLGIGAITSGGLERYLAARGLAAPRPAVAADGQ